MYAVAQNIVLKAQSIGLNVVFERPTIGDGNCFYHAVVECAKKNGTFYGSHKDLRFAAADFVSKHRNDDFVVNWEETHINENADESIVRQFLLGVHVTELFIHATAMLLDTVIIITKADSTSEYPYCIFWPSLSSLGVTPQLKEYTGRYILLGHSMEHFQSLFFSGIPHWENKVVVEKRYNIKRTYADVLNSSQMPEINKSIQMSFMSKCGSKIINNCSNQCGSKISRLDNIMSRFSADNQNPKSDSTQQEQEGVDFEIVSSENKTDAAKQLNDSSLIKAEEKLKKMHIK